MRAKKKKTPARPPKRKLDAVAQQAADAKRLDWLEKQDGWALVSDDAGRWACVCDGTQNVPDFDKAIDIVTSFDIKAREWRKSPRAAIDAAMKK